MSVTPSRGAQLLITASVLLAAGCGLRDAGPYVLELPGVTAMPVVRGAWIDSYPRAVASISAILERDLALPPVQASLHFYRSRADLASALVEAGYEPVLARGAALTMNAVGGPRRILLNDSALADYSWPLRIGILAHELVHTSQYELAGGRRGMSDQWVREGFSEWAALHVLEQLGISNLGLVRFERLRDIREARRLPPLLTLTTFRQWVAMTGHRDGRLAYPYAFVAVDHLIDRHGLPRVRDYFRVFAFTDDRAWAFRTVFGEDVSSFERTFKAYLASDRSKPIGWQARNGT